MTLDQGLILLILACAMGLFLWGRLRHDIVALCALMACVLAGLVEPATAFAGFGHPAVITVACVLVLSKGLQTSGAVDVIARHALPSGAGLLVSMGSLVALGAVLSGFMNNVGAMALLMPVAVRLAGRFDMAPGQVLMPLAFGTILGGMTTLIGTPPNLIVSGFRADLAGEGFAMFDFTPVGLAVAGAGLVFVLLAARWLVPANRSGGEDEFTTGAYMTEARVGAKSRAAGLTLRQVEDLFEDADAQVLAIIRKDVRITAPHRRRKVLAGDILVLEADVEDLPDVLSALGVKLEERGASTPARAEARDTASTRSKARDSEDGEGARTRDDGSDEIVLREFVVLPEALMTGRSARDLHLRTRFGINLLAVSRDGQRSRARLRTMKIRAGDLLLLEGAPEALADFASDMGLAPLAERELRVPEPRKAIIASVIMAGAVGGAAFGLLPAAISFAMGVAASMITATVPPRTAYQAIDWPVVVLLAALIPVAGAMETTGVAGLIADGLIGTVAMGNAILALAAILIVTMFLSDLMNNAATAAVMCPVAIGAAAVLGVNADAFLMAVAIGASCAFLTPIGHQNNTLILGPGGFRFGDYWRLGLPLEAVVVAVSLPMLLWIWPL
ncbi:SLC13 family permease [Alkalicaulis satelles]|uniref:SLC13 family permease n=1 Tax=Alkalicaulis satelles TaxID=2609175 RepID=A0A5M6ZIR8_9PROT|nr:SLC13 family permease [Alkalicaulis satelles]KAA5804679.1 SLC13 family permease [Alkalicaulis satelles]